MATSEKRKRGPKVRHAKSVVFGEVLRTRREAVGITQTDLAKRVKLASQEISRLERGIVDPTWSRIIELAEALGVTPNDFLPPENPSCDT